MAKFPRLFLGTIGNYAVLVDYDEPDAITRAIIRNGFSHTYIHEDIKISEIPLGGTGRGKVTEKIHQVCFGGAVYNREVPQKLREGHGYANHGGYESAGALAALTYAAMNPDRQRACSLVTLFRIGLQLYSLHLYGTECIRALEILPAFPNGLWPGKTEFLAAGVRRLNLRVAQLAHSHI